MLFIVLCTVSVKTKKSWIAVDFQFQIITKWMSQYFMCRKIRKLRLDCHEETGKVLVEFFVFLCQIKMC